MRYVKPPDALVTQIDVYTEEKYEDEEDLRERGRNLVRDHTRAMSESEAALDELIRIAQQHEDLFPIMVETLKRYALILEKDILPYVFFFVLLHAANHLMNKGRLFRQTKSDLLTVLDKFVEQAASLDNL